MDITVYNNIILMFYSKHAKVARLVAKTANPIWVVFHVLKGILIL